MITAIAATPLAERIRDADRVSGIEDWGQP